MSLLQVRTVSLLCVQHHCAVSGLRVLIDRLTIQIREKNRRLLQPDDVRRQFRAWKFSCIWALRDGHKCQLIYVIWSPVLRLVNQVLPHTERTVSPLQPSSN